MIQLVTRPVPPRLSYSVAEAARATGIGRTTLYRLMGDDVRPSIKIGNRRLIRAADLETLLAAGAAA